MGVEDEQQSPNASESPTSGTKPSRKPKDFSSSISVTSISEPRRVTMSRARIRSPAHWFRRAQRFTWSLLTILANDRFRQSCEDPVCSSYPELRRSPVPAFSNLLQSCYDVAVVYSPRLRNNQLAARTCTS